MAVSMNDVRRVLDPEEPDYATAARLGPDAIPHLRALVTGPDSMMASKAAYAASVLEGDVGASVVQAAAQSGDPVVRVAAAAAASNLPTHAARTVLVNLVDDDDPGVSKVARLAAPAGP